MGFPDLADSWVWFDTARKPSGDWYKGCYMSEQRARPDSSGHRTFVPMAFRLFSSGRLMPQSHLLSIGDWFYHCISPIVAWEGGNFGEYSWIASSCQTTLATNHPKCLTYNWGHRQGFHGFPSGIGQRMGMTCIWRSCYKKVIQDIQGMTCVKLTHQILISVRLAINGTWWWMDNVLQKIVDNVISKRRFPHLFAFAISWAAKGRTLQPVSYWDLWVIAAWASFDGLSSAQCRIYKSLFQPNILIKESLTQKHPCYGLLTMYCIEFETKKSDEKNEIRWEG